MEITSASGAPASTSLGSAANAGASSAITADFETFLKMLTEQLKNQDPLNPLEATDFAVQLATFSGVEQQVRTNDLLGSFSDQFSLWGMSNLAGWIGRDVRAAVPVRFEGGPIQLETVPVPDARMSFLEVTDADGLLVDRVQIPVDGDRVAWDGIPEGEPRLPFGTYSFEVVSYDGEEDVISAYVPETYVRVSEIRVGDDGPLLVLDGGTEIDVDRVSAVRVP